MLQIKQITKTWRKTKGIPETKGTSRKSQSQESEKIEFAVRTIKYQKNLHDKRGGEKIITRICLYTDPNVWLILTLLILGLELRHKMEHDGNRRRMRNQIRASNRTPQQSWIISLCTPPVQSVSTSKVIHSAAVYCL